MSCAASASRGPELLHPRHPMEHDRSLSLTLLAAGPTLLDPGRSLAKTPCTRSRSRSRNTPRSPSVSPPVLPATAASHRRLPSLPVLLSREPRLLRVEPPTLRREQPRPRPASDPLERRSRELQRPTTARTAVENETTTTSSPTTSQRPVEAPAPTVGAIAAPALPPATEA